MTELADYLAELIHAQFENRTPEKIPEGLTMEELSRAAVENHMEYLIFGGLLRTENLPPEWKEPLKKRVMSGIFRTMTQVRELQEMESRFEAAGVVNQPMKGARMKFIYPSPQMREMSDIDVLIGQEDRKKAGEVLSQMGYVLSQDIKHHEIYVKKPFMVVEAHRAMYDRTVDENQYQYFSDFSRAVLREGCAYTYDFNREDFYVYLIAHMAKHFYTMGCGIRNLLDIYVYQEKYKGEMNWKYVKQELKKLGLLSFAEHMEKLAYVWMEKEEAGQFECQLFDYMLNSGIYGKDENGIWNKFAEEKCRDREVTRFRLKMWYFFPPVSYMAEYYPWLEEHAFLLPAAWCIRFFRGLFLKKGMHKREMLHDIEKEQVKIYQNIYQQMELRFKG